MTKRKPNSRPERRVYVRGVRRDQPDLRRLARVLIDFARAEAEAQAAAEHDALVSGTTAANNQSGGSKPPTSPEHGEAA